MELLARSFQPRGADRETTAERDARIEARKYLAQPADVSAFAGLNSAERAELARPIRWLGEPDAHLDELAADTFENSIESPESGLLQNLPHDDDEQDDDDLMCMSCDGSGLGQFDGWTCASCGGKGIELAPREDYRDDEDRYEDRRYLAQEIDDDDRRAGL